MCMGKKNRRNHLACAGEKPCAHARTWEEDSELRAGGKSWAYTPHGHAARPCAGEKSRKEGRDEGSCRTCNPTAGIGILSGRSWNPVLRLSVVHPATGSSALPPHAALPLCFLCFVRLQICASTTHLCSSSPQGFVAASSAPRIRGCLLCSTSRQLRVRGIFSVPFFALPSPPHVLCSLLCSGFYI